MATTPTIDALLEQWIAAFNSRDLDAHMALYREDATLFGSVDELKIGRDVIRTYFSGRGPGVMVKSYPMPRVAMLSFSNFGHPMRERAQVIRDAVKMLDDMHVSFEYDGEMNADVALDGKLMRRVYPFSRLTDSANVLIMPGLASASISSHMLQKLGGGTVIGPLLIGLEKSAQIVHMGTTVSDMVNMAALAAYDAIE